MRLILRIISDTDVPDIESPERNVHIKIKQKKVERVENKSTFYSNFFKTDTDKK